MAFDRGEVPTDTDSRDESPGSISRRELLQGAAAAGSLSLLSTGASADEQAEVVVRAEDVDVPLLASSSVVDELKATAAESQEPIVEYVENTDGLAVKNQFWLANALLLEVDTDLVDLEALAARKGVSRVHPNFQLELPEPEVDDDADDASTDVTYGLDQINAPAAWEAFGSRGEGARIAVLDTGVDPDHPDIDVDPENFAEFDPFGNDVWSDPHDSHHHGTHVSGTVVGGDASGTAIGVAPDATLLAGLVLQEGFGTFTQVISGMQWAVEQDADAINMSFGFDGYATEFVEPVRNAERAGSFVVAAAGNSGDGTSGSPANVYDSFAVGASTRTEHIAWFSSGEVIDTDDAWGHYAPDDWPGEYVVPNVVAPGHYVLSANPTDHWVGPYRWRSGTSMAAPHVAGLVGLVRSAAVEPADVDRLRTAITTTAWKPDDESSEPDTRYGQGIVDALAAVGRFAADGGVTGVVTDTDGNPIAGATVELDGFPTETDADGEYTLRTIEGTYEVSVDAFGYTDQTVTVDVTDEFLTRDFALGDELAVSIAADQPEGLQAGESFDVEIEVANAEALTVELAGDYEGDAWLSIEGEPAAFGEPVVLDEPTTGTVTAMVETGEDGLGDLDLDYTFEGLGETVTLTTGPTSVYETPAPIAVVDVASGEYGDDVRAMLESELHPRYHLSVVEPGEALAAANEREYEAYVVQNLGDDEGLVAEFAEVAAAPEVGVVYLDQFGEASDAISQLSAATRDPEWASEGYTRYSTSPVSYEVREDHPALAGIAGAGDSLTITAPEIVEIVPWLRLGSLHAYFEDYRGPVTKTTLAEVGVEGAVTGVGLAVNDLSRIVLAASLGVSEFLGPEHFTSDGRSLLANLVAHVTRTPSIEVVESPAEQADPGAPVSATIAVEDLVELEVGVSGLQIFDEDDLTLTVDGEEVSFGESITYEEPREGTVEMTIQTPPNTLGEFALDVRFVTLGRGNREVETAATFHPTTIYESPIQVPRHIDDLQAAVDFVRPGDAVVLADGTYEVESDRDLQTGLHVDTPGITIRGAEGANPEIVHARDTWHPRIVVVDADGVTIENLSANVIDGAIDERHQGGNGIRIESFTSATTIRNVTVAGGVAIHLGGSISDVYIKDVSVIDSLTGVGTGSGTGPVSDVTITDSTFGNMRRNSTSAINLEDADSVTVTNCEIDPTNATLGVRIEGYTYSSRTTVVADNSITSTAEDESNALPAIGIKVVDVDAEIRNNAIAGVGSGIHVGDIGPGYSQPSVFVEDNVVENATIGFDQDADRVALKRNTFEAEIGLRFGNPYFSLDADAVVARYNDLSATDLPFAAGADPYWGSPYGPYDARLNYLGDRDYDDTIADGNVVYDPFLTVPPAEVEVFPPTEIATDLTLDAGKSYGLGIPGPTDATIWEILGVESYGDFDGDVEFWNHDSDRWQSVTGEGDLQYADTLYAFRVTPEEGVRAVVDFQRADDPPVGPDGTPPGHRDSEPGRTHLREGPNFVAAPAYGEEDAVFDPSVVNSVDDSLHSPASQIGDDYLDAFAGYVVESSEETWLDGGLDAYDPTMDELYESLGLDPAIHDDPGPAGSASGTTPTVADLVESAPDEGAAADAVATLVGHRIARRLDAADDPEATLDAIEAATTAAAEEVPDDERDLVEDAIERAVVEAIWHAFGATPVEKSDENDETTSLKAPASPSAD